MGADLNYGKGLDLFDLALEMQQSSEGVSLAEIMQKFACSRRTAERMRDALMTFFPHLEEVPTGERIKRWRIPQRSLNSLISFSVEELSSFDTAIEALEKQNLFEKAELLSRSLLKIKNILKQEEKRKIEVDAEELIKSEGLAWSPGPKIKSNNVFLSIIRKAILSCNKIKIKYNKKGKSEERIISPYGFLYGATNHYLVAKNQKDEFRSFIISAIEEIEVLEEVFVFEKDFSLKKYIHQSFGTYQEKPFKVEWLFQKNVASLAKSYLFHPSQKMTENEDGTLTVQFKAGGILEMAWHLKMWGDSVTVIQPKDFETKALNAQHSFENQNLG